MMWYEAVLLFLFYVLAFLTLYLLLKEERKRSAAFVKKEIAQRQFYEHYLRVLPMWELYLQGYANQAPGQARLTELMIKSLEDIENV